MEPETPKEDTAGTEPTVDPSYNLEDLPAGLDGMSPDDLVAAGLADLSERVAAKEPSPAPTGEQAPADAAKANVPDQGGPKSPESQKETEGTQAPAEPKKPEDRADWIPPQRLSQEQARARRAQEAAEQAAREAAQLRETVSYLTGRMESFQTQQPGQPKPPTLEEQVAAKGQELDALSKKYEAGEIDTAEYVRSNSKLVKEETALEMQIFFEKNKPKDAPQQPRQPQPDVNAAAQAAIENQRIVEEHPWVNHIPPQAHALVVARAIEESAKQGYDIAIVRDNAGNPVTDDYGAFVPATPQAVSQLRHAYGVMADVLGPTLTGKTAEELGIKKQAAAQPQPQPNPAQPDKAAADRAEAMKRAAAMPPDIASAGTAADKPGLTPEGLAAISAHNPNDLESVPQVQLDAILKS